MFRVRHDHYHHYPATDVFESVTRKLDQILTQGAQIMSLADQLRTELGKVNASTSEIAADQRELVERLKNGSLSDAEKTEILGALAAHAAELDSIAAAYPVVEPPAEPPV